MGACQGEVLSLLLMGSYFDLSLAMVFADETPLEIVGAFSEWLVPTPAGVDRPPPELPSLASSLAGDEFHADDYLADFFSSDPMEGLPLLHQAALWHWVAEWGGTATPPGVPRTALAWDPRTRRWNLTIRVEPKHPAWPFEILGPLGRHSALGTPEQPWLAGCIVDRPGPSPILIWSVAGEPFRFEGELAPR